jgi:hypothetical protein
MLITKIFHRATHNCFDGLKDSNKFLKKVILIIKNSKTKFNMSVLIDTYLRLFNEKYTLSL